MEKLENQIKKLFYLSIIIVIICLFISCTTVSKIDSDNLTENIFYYEEFSDIEEGLLPEGWIGGSTVGVKKGILTNFSKGNHSFTIPDIEFPENFTVLFVLKTILPYRIRKWDKWKFNIGNIVLLLNTDGNLYFGGSEIKYHYDTKNYHMPRYFQSENSNERFYYDSYITKLEIKKKGPVFTLIINNIELKTIRFPNFKGSSIDINIIGDFKLKKIIGCKN